MDKMDIIKNVFCSFEDIGKQMKKQTIQWKKIFTVHISDKGLLSRIYKGFPQINNKDKRTQLNIGKHLE